MITELARRKRLELPLEARMSSWLTVPARAYPVTKACLRRQKPIQSPGLIEGTASRFRVTLPQRSWYLSWYIPRRRRFLKNYKTISTGYHEEFRVPLDSSWFSAPLGVSLCIRRTE